MTEVTEDDLARLDELLSDGNHQAPEEFRTTILSLIHPKDIVAAFTTMLPVSTSPTERPTATDWITSIVGHNQFVWVGLRYHAPSFDRQTRQMSGFGDIKTSVLMARARPLASITEVSVNSITRHPFTEDLIWDFRVHFDGSPGNPVNIIDPRVLHDVKPDDLARADTVVRALRDRAI